MIRLGRRFGWGLGLLAFAAVVVFLMLPREPKPDTDDEKQPPIQRKSRLAMTPGGDVILSLDSATQERAALKIATLAASRFQPEIAAYGRLQEDPSEAFELRAPVAGTLRAPADRAWPSIGDVVGDGATIGLVQPRLLPMDRLGISDRLIAARSEAKAAAASADAARASHERTRALNEDNRNASDRALQEAEARLKAEEARLKAALESVKLLDAALEPSASPAGNRPLVALRGGEVSEVLAQPGEAVESGQSLMRLRRYDRLIARIYLPAGQNAGTFTSRARLTPAGNGGESLEGRLIGIAGAVDPESQVQPLLFRVPVPRRDLRPGLAVTAYLPVRGQVMNGVVIPESAVVRFAGKAWAYIKSGEDKFVRKEVMIDYPTEKGWFATLGFSAGEQIVVAGAQLLLSEELKSQIQVGEENPA